MRYFPLAVGNYWIYEVVRYDPSTYTGTVQQSKDTMLIYGDTSIRGHQYFKIQTDRFASSAVSVLKDTTYLRDSSGYIVNSIGDIKFTAIDFDRILHRENLVETPLFSVYSEYSVKDTLIYEFTSIGLLACLDFRGCVYKDDVKLENYLRNYYSEDIGLTYQSTFYISNPLGIEIRRSLIDYHLEE